MPLAYVVLCLCISYVAVNQSNSPSIDIRQEPHAAVAKPIESFTKVLDDVSADSYSTEDSADSYDEDSYDLEDSEDDEDEEFVAKGSSDKKGSNSKFLLIVFMFDVSLTEFLKISSSPHYHTSILLFYLLRTLSSLSPQTLSSLFSRRRE